MDQFYSQNGRLSKIRIPGGGANIPMITPRVASPVISGKLRHKQSSRNSPTDYSPSYINLLRHLQANSPSSTVQNIEEGTLVVDIIRDEVGASSLSMRNRRKAIHRVRVEPSGSYQGQQLHHPRAGYLPSRLTLRRSLEERRMQARAIAEAAATPVAPPRSPQARGKSNTKILHRDWSPLDDGIQVELPSQSGENPLREGVDDYIENFIRCGSICRHRRLPIFFQMCTP
ncbi:hypothetical protein MLD38_026913 [Melastoma candidum]|uniref:Uncharacterized protein n=1 Tax=Melastoma candidum TaxID=119954 RepID=A0ACB9P111_9MYRT|nr:hypothetical protein MLD38_026913 [Melastoma candidum]